MLLAAGFSGRRHLDPETEYEPLVLGMNVYLEVARLLLYTESALGTVYYRHDRVSN